MMGDRFYVYYNNQDDRFDVVDSSDGVCVYDFQDEEEAFLYCDHLNENDY